MATGLSTAVMDRRVYMIRLEVHNMRAYENQEREGKSENHVTIALLLGDGQTVRLDMGTDPITFAGVLEIAFRENIVSGRTIRISDTRVTGCPRDFDPDHTRAASGGNRRVRDFLMLMRGNSRQLYRFMCTDFVAQGCRFWVYVSIPTGSRL